jgi:hypothetical protein
LGAAGPGRTSSASSTSIIRPSTRRDHLIRCNGANVGESKVRCELMQGSVSAAAGTSTKQHTLLVEVVKSSAVWLKETNRRSRLLITWPGVGGRKRRG